MKNNIPSGAKKHRKSTQPESCQTAKTVMKESRKFELAHLKKLKEKHFSHKTTEFSIEQCTSPSLFYRFEISQGGLNRSLNYGFLCNDIFSSCVCMRTNHLATKCNYYARLLN